MTTSASKGDEINPDHPTTKGISDQWHKIAALILYKIGWDEILLTVDDVERGLAEGSMAVVAHETKDGLKIKRMTMADALVYARESGTPID